MEDKLLEVLSKIDAVMSEYHITTQESLLVGMQIIKASFAQIAEDNPKADRESLVRGFVETLDKALRNIVLYPHKNIGS